MLSLSDGFKRKAFLSAIAYASVILFYLDWYGYFGFTGTWEGIPIFERMIDLYTRFWPQEEASQKGLSHEDQQEGL